MTHAYVIATRGFLPGAGAAAGSDEPAGECPTALAWAAERVLAIGPDDVVAAISRGDSILLDLAGCAVTPAPSDRAGAERVVREAVAAGGAFAPVALLARAGLVGPGATIEVGSPADLAFWSADPCCLPPSSASSLRIVAIVRDGAFTTGDEHAGPFARLPAPAPTHDGD